MPRPKKTDPSKQPAAVAPAPAMMPMAMQPMPGQIPVQPQPLAAGPAVQPQRTIGIEEFIRVRDSVSNSTLLIYLFILPILFLCLIPTPIALHT